ncbi:MAG: serine/threonine protein kinase [Pirellulales bacterium]|nr:serine/threonine protein kinase [Pirellulales bacterium]
MSQCRSSTERAKLIADMTSTEVERVGWKTERVKHRLGLFTKYSRSRPKLAAVVRGLYADRLKAGGYPRLEEFQPLGIPMDRLRLRAENEPVFLGYVVSGRYRLDRLLGVGGFGVVYRARDRRQAGAVAVKTIHGADTSTKRLARRLLEAEGNALCTLAHEGIPKLVDRIADGRLLCLVLEYVDGGTLFDLFKQGCVTVGRAARLVAAIAGTLDFAHRRGYIHRDLKLTNVLLSKDDRPYLADFGLALTSDDQFDRDGEWVSSPGYTAVESQLGMTREIDGRADVFSAGVILYELLTGSALMSRECREGSLVEGILLERRRLWFPKHVPHELRRICKKCLPRDPNNRYHTAGHLHSDLNAFLAEGRYGQEKSTSTR